MIQKYLQKELHKEYKRLSKKITEYYEILSGDVWVETTPLEREIMLAEYHNMLARKQEIFIMLNSIYGMINVGGEQHPTPDYEEGKVTRS